MFPDFSEPNDPSLKQGEKFNTMIKTFDRMVNPQLKIIEQGSPKVLEGFRENMGPGEAKLQGISDEELKTLNNLETQFNNKLNQYKAAFKGYLTELTNQQNVQSANYKNKVITGPQGSKYWVNNMGYTRKFSTDAWSKRDSSCPTTSGNVSQQDLATYPQGQGMNPYEKCGPVGINVQSSAGGGTAWLSANGQKHPYQDFRNKNQNCPSEVTTLTPQQYNAIPTGKVWTSSDSCNLLGSSEKWNDVAKLNNELISISNQMNQQVQVLAAHDTKIDAVTRLQKQKLINKAKDLDAERKLIDNAITSILTSDGDLEDKRLEVSSSNLHYMAWLLAFVTLGGIAVQQVLKR